MDAVTRTTTAQLDEGGGRTSLAVEAEIEEVGAFESLSMAEWLGVAVPKVSIGLSVEEKKKYLKKNGR
ncbi:unnamed protein product [Haemonchus placei]|uniref:Uncharacterized protein n=1 Tax=Haemonchus placei TaxID=6290 RepID=A0A0N4WZ56_HAEPC|nr:unnamed protein product [Haemonchus placei]